MTLAAGATTLGIVLLMTSSNRVRLTAESLIRRSPIIRQLVDAKQLKIAAAMHDITTGKVSWLS